MELKSRIKRAFRKLSEIKKGRFHLRLLSSFFIPILLILFLDLFNVEATAAFNQKFMFEFTWKGRMFYLFFMWLFLLETILDWKTIIQKQPTFQNRFRIIITCILMIIPTVYILSFNFLGLNQTIINLGQNLKITPDFINDWTLTIEYLVLVSCFILATWSAYGIAGLKSFSISLSLLAGISVVYLVDTMRPYGSLEPMQLLTIPTAAYATSLLDLMGYSVTLLYPVSDLNHPEYGTFPRMIVSQGGKTAQADVAWPCAGVHSLLLFTLIALVFLKKTTMRRERKIIFFLIGAAGTYLTNIFRVASYFIIYIQYGKNAADVFHGSYGELYFIAWMFLFFMIVIVIQSGIINRFVKAFRQGLRTFVKRLKRVT